MLSIIGWGLIILAIGVIFSGIVGFFRFPDFYAKVHAGGIIDSCGVPMSLVGLACLQTNYISAFKLLFAACLVLLLSPAATNGLAKAAIIKAGLKGRVEGE